MLSGRYSWAGTYGLWFVFGHNHHGLTLGPVTRRPLAQVMTGEPPCVDPKPYAPRRFD
jgi:D-amino-acid dehydrogenase